MGRKAYGKGTGKAGPRRKRSPVHIDDHSALRRDGDETTHYLTKPHRESIAIQRLAKYRSARNIAKALGLPLREVRDELERLRAEGRL
jgi:hypothetical protein